MAELSTSHEIKIPTVPEFIPSGKINKDGHPLGEYNSNCNLKGRFAYITVYGTPYKDKSPRQCGVLLLCHPAVSCDMYQFFLNLSKEDGCKWEVKKDFDIDELGHLIGGKTPTFNGSLGCTDACKSTDGRKRWSLCVPN